MNAMADPFPSNPRCPGPDPILRPMHPRASICAPSAYDTMSKKQKQKVSDPWMQRQKAIRKTPLVAMLVMIKQGEMGKDAWFS